MSWKIVRQPNDRYSRFSEVGDDFTRMNMSRNDAWELCRHDVGPRLADVRMKAADSDRFLWTQILDVIRLSHGEDHMRMRQATGCTL
jgi:hypothetical protein